MEGSMSVERAKERLQAYAEVKRRLRQVLAPYLPLLMIRQRTREKLLQELDEFSTCMAPELARLNGAELTQMLKEILR